MKNIFKTSLVVTLVFFLGSCTNESLNENMSSNANKEIAWTGSEVSVSELGETNVQGNLSLTASAASNNLSVKRKIDRKLIKQGSLQFEVTNIDSVKQSIKSVLSHFGGYVSFEQSYKTYNKLNATIKVRVPNEKFDAFLESSTAGVNEFDSKEINVKDVTEEYIDVEARLKTKLELERRYLSLLSKAKTIKDILDIEIQLEEVRMDIERIQGRLNYLKSKTSMATIDFDLYQMINNEKVVKEENRFIRGLKKGWQNVVSFFVGLAYVWPFLIILGVIIYFYRKTAVKKENTSK